MVESVAFDPKQTRIASSARDSIRIWNLTSGHDKMTMQGHSTEVRCVAFSPDGTRVASGGETGRIWDAKTGRELFTLKGETGAVRCLAFSPDGDRIATGSFDSPTKLWDAATGDWLLTLGEEKSISLGFHPDGSLLGSGSSGRNKTATIWNTSNGEKKRTLPSDVSNITAVSYGPYGQHLVTGGNDHAVRVWNASTGQQVHCLLGHIDQVTDVGFDRSGERVISGSTDSTIIVWDVLSGQPLLTLSGRQQGVTGVAFSPDGKRIASSGHDKTIQMWDAATGRATMTLNGHRQNVTGITFNSTGDRIASSSVDKTVRIWNATQRQTTFTLPGSRFAAFSPDGSQIAARQFNTVVLCDAATGRETSRLIGHTGVVISADFSPDGTRFVTAGSDGTLRVWDPAEENELFPPLKYENNVTSVAFLSDGTRIVAGSYRGAKVWDASSGQELATLQGARWA